MKSFIKIYVDNIIIKTKSLTNHLSNFKFLFKLFIEYNILISLIKTFLNYFNVNFLKQRVNLFDLITIKNKFKTIKTLKYSTILKILKYYINLTNYLRNYVYYFTQLIILF